MIDTLIQLAKLGNNTYLIQKLELIQKTLIDNPNDLKLGEEMRKLLQ